jgi:hypothetical protein
LERRKVVQDQVDLARVHQEVSYIFNELVLWFYAPFLLFFGGFVLVFRVPSLDFETRVGSGQSPRRGIKKDFA